MYFLNQEQKLISRIKNLVGPSGKFIGDDCAVLPGNLLVTTDTLVDQTHFRLNWTGLSDLGWKAMAVNLSDIAAMAGKPEYAFITLSAPSDFYMSNKVLSLYKGMIACAQHYHTGIVGGDITRAANLSITVTILGRAHKAGVLRRSGARAGDVILVTGDFGASAAGLRLLADKAGSVPSSALSFRHCLAKFRRPQPRLKESWQLIEKSRSRGALMDASDGLADALAQIAQASSVGMQINLDSLPIDKQTLTFAAKAKIDPYELALYGGEDYELVACMAAQDWEKWQRKTPNIANIFKQIGVVNNKNDIQLMFGNETGYKLDLRRIFQHIA